MNKSRFPYKFIFLLGLCVLWLGLQAQVADSQAVATAADTAKATRQKPRASDTAKVAVVPVVKPADTTLRFFNELNPDLPVNGSFFFRLEENFEPASKDLVFYIVGGMLLMLGIMRIVFSKYYADLLRIFSQTTFKQKSIREQLLQNKLASLLLNLFFCISAGTFLFFLAQFKNWLPITGIWWHQLLLCMAFIAGVYLVKFVGMQVSGWLFGLRELADSYTFMVFLVNKVVGIMLLPATVALALGAPDLKAIFTVASLVCLAALYLYRYVIALPMLRQHVRIVPLHFFLYFCAFEIIPVLVVYKVLLTTINR